MEHVRHQTVGLKHRKGDKWLSTYVCNIGLKGLFVVTGVYIGAVYTRLLHTKLHHFKVFSVLDNLYFLERFPDNKLITKSPPAGTLSDHL